MSVPAATVRTRGRRYFTAEVEVEIGPDELDEAGWHHEDDLAGSCYHPGHGDHECDHPDLPWARVAEAITSLHRQAHPSQHADPVLCHEEPCRSLPLDALRMPP